MIEKSLTSYLKMTFRNILISNFKRRGFVSVAKMKWHGYYLYSYLNSSALNSFFLNPATTSFCQTSKSTQHNKVSKTFQSNYSLNLSDRRFCQTQDIRLNLYMLRGNTFRCKFFRLVVGYESALVVYFNGFLARSSRRLHEIFSDTLLLNPYLLANNSIARLQFPLYIIYKYTEF